MKKFKQSAFVVAILAGMLSLCATAWSQTERDATKTAPSARATREAAKSAGENVPHMVGLIDMAHVFKHYKKFDFLREDLKAQIGQSEGQAKEMAKEIQALQGQMKELKEGNPDFAAKEKQLQHMTLEFESFRKSTQREILKEESAIYHKVYMEVSDAVRMYSKYYKYTLVLRFNREDLNPEDPQGLIQGMNRQVVFHRQEDDMTDSVLDYLNKKFEESQSGNKPARPAKEANSSTKTKK